MAKNQTAASFGLQRCYRLEDSTYDFEFLQPWLDPAHISTNSQDF